jgi:predicted Ser/Thr protein kinase
VDDPQPSSASQAASAEPKRFMAQAVEESRARFAAEKALLSFREYLDVVATSPAAQARDAATYLRDCFDHYGTEKVTRPYGRFTRFRLFDAPFDGGRDAVRGHEPVQEQLYGLLTDFVRQGRVTRLVLLHGPNGSAKTSLIHCMIRAMEAYSRLPDGAMYTFNWVFPSSRLERGAIGFSGARGVADLDSFAHLAESDVDTRLRTETRDHPLLLLPRATRVALLRAHLGPDHPIPASLSEGELSPKARQVFDALLRAYKGDLGEVLKHVQVERFYVSHRYRTAAVTVDPQMRADAGVRQVTGDRSLGSLPPSLQNVALYEPVGDLVEANRGILEFNDLLKRPVEAFKYLLSTCENGTVRLDTMTLHLDTFFVGSCNAGLLDAFVQMPDFASFKARIELIQVPYLVDYEQERRIYAQLLASQAIDKPVAPHTDEVAALWAVLTRLERPRGEEFPDALRKAIVALTPIEKAMLYARGEAPSGLSRDTAGNLVAAVADLHAQTRREVDYEGRVGASPREIKAALLSAARRGGNVCLAPLAVFEELRALCEQTSVHRFLQEKPDGQFRQPHKFIAAVRDWYLDRVEDELNEAMGLVEVGAAPELFHRYVDHVTHFVRREKRLNPMTGRYEDPDERLMRRLEQYFGNETKDAEDFRAGVMHRIAAWRMENPDAPLDLTQIFADRIQRLNEGFYLEKKGLADQIKNDLLTLLVAHESQLSDENRARAEATFERLESQFGYNRATAMEVVGALLKARPPER